MLLYELHAHTKECDDCATVGGAELVRLYYEAGYAGIVITDHYFERFFKWFADDLPPAARITKGQLYEDARRHMTEAEHRAVIDRRLRGYYAAKNEGEKLGVTVLPGAEVRFNGANINDYLVYGCDEAFFYQCPCLSELGSLSNLVAALPPEACVVHAHPFRLRMTVVDPTPIFGIEAHNGHTEPFRNEMAAAYAAHYAKPTTSGSDFHHPEHLGRGGILTDTPIRTPRELADTLRSGRYSLYCHYAGK